MKRIKKKLIALSLSFALAFSMLSSGAVSFAAETTENISTDSNASPDETKEEITTEISTESEDKEESYQPVVGPAVSTEMNTVGAYMGDLNIQDVPLLTAIGADSGYVAPYKAGDTYTNTNEVVNGEGTYWSVNHKFLMITTTDGLTPTLYCTEPTAATPNSSTLYTEYFATDIGTSDGKKTMKYQGVMPYAYSGYAGSNNNKEFYNWDTNGEYGGTFGTYVTGGVARQGMMVNGVFYEMTPQEAAATCAAAIHKLCGSNITSIYSLQNSSHSTAVADCYSALVDMGEFAYNEAVNHNSYWFALDGVNKAVNMNVSMEYTYWVRNPDAAGTDAEWVDLSTIPDSQSGAYDWSGYVNDSGEVELCVRFETTGLETKMFSSSQSGTDGDITYNHTTITTCNFDSTRDGYYDYFVIEEGSSNTIPVEISYEGLMAMDYNLIDPTTCTDIADPSTGSAMLGTKFYQDAYITVDYADLKAGKVLDLSVSSGDCMRAGMTSGDPFVPVAKTFYASGYQDVTLGSPNGSESKSSTLYAADVYYPYAMVMKKSANEDVTANNGCYSLKGAEYTIYTDTACTTKATAYTYKDTVTYEKIPAEPVFVTDASGNSNKLVLESGVYYVKETKASSGYMLDNTVHRLVVKTTDENGRLHDENNPIVITSTEIPVDDPVSIEINKVDKEGITMINSTGSTEGVDVIGGASLAGAVFEVSFYNDYYDSLDDVSNIPADRKWYIETKYDSDTKTYKTELNSQYLSNKYNNSEIFYNGKGEETFPLGTVIIKEVKASDGYMIENSVMTDKSGVCDEAVFIGQVRSIDSNNDGNVDEAALFVSSDSDNSFSNNQSGTPIKVFTTPQEGSAVAISEQILRGDFSFVKTDYITSVEMEDVFFKVTSSAGESHYVKTGENGFYSSETTAEVGHDTYTNYYDRLFDDDETNDYLPDGTYIGDIDCGIWFFGTADETKWDYDDVTNDKGALRYDESYTLTEIVTDVNEGKQMIVDYEIAVTNERVNFVGVLSNVPEPFIHTLEWDKNTKTHLSVAGSSVTIVDTVSYNYLTAGNKYTVKGILMELDEEGNVTGPLLDSDGNIITSYKVFTVDSSYTKSPQEKCGSVDVTYTFDASLLRGKKFVIYEYLYEGEDETDIFVNDDTVDETDVMEVNGNKVKHDDSADEDQIGYFADIDTNAFAADTEINVTRITDDMKIKDSVSYVGLNEGYEYKLITTLKYVDVRDNEIKDILDKDGNILKGTTVFTAESTDGVAVTELPSFDGTQLLDEDGNQICDGVVVFQQLYWNNTLYAAHEDINDADQTVWIPKIGTTATDTESGLHMTNADEEVSITDIVEYEDLIIGKEYEVSGYLMNKTSNKELLDENGNKITANTKFTPEETNGTVALTFTFDASLLAGESIVVFESVYYNGIEVGTHADIEDEDQTIHFPKLKTSLAEGETGTKTVLYTDDVYLIDTVSYENLVPGYTYMLTGNLMNKDTEQPVMVDGKIVTGTTTFVAEKSDGKTEVEYKFDATKTDLIKEDGSMSATVCFEELTVINDVEESGHYETVVTPEYEETTYKTVYTCKGCNTDFDSKTAADNHINADDEDNCGAYDILSEVDEVIFHSETSEEKYIVDVTEHTDYVIVATHRDINDVDQTLTPPVIKTTAHDNETNTNLAFPDELVTITDIVDYEGLTPNKTYTVEGHIMLKVENEDGTIEEEELLIAENPVVASTTFTPKTSSGSVEVEFVIDGSELMGERIVVFEYMYYDKKLVCVHADINDDNQTIKFPEIGTTATDKNDGDKVLAMNETVTVKDEIEYKNLNVNETYVVYGKVMDVSTSSVAISEGKEVMTVAEFTPESENGTFVMEFTFSTEGLEDRKLVVFEDIRIKGTDTKIAVHEDWEDESQTVTIPKEPKTGEDSMFKLMILFAGFSLAGAMITIIYKKRKKTIS